METSKTIETTNNDELLPVGLMMKEILNATAEVGAEIQVTRDGQPPYFIVSTDMFCGRKHYHLYEGTDLTKAITAIRKTTVFTEEQRKEAKRMLSKGYNLAPTLEGKFVLLDNRNTILMEGSIEECYKEIASKKE